MFDSKAILVVMATVCGVAGAAAGPAKPPYAVPWQMRPLVLAKSFRLDASVAQYHRGQATGLATASVIAATWPLAKDLGLVVRMPWVVNQAVGEAKGAATWGNPFVGVTWLRQAAPWRVAGLLAVTVPVAGGGGSSPDAGRATSLGVGLLSRFAMDNALFAANYSSAIVGVGAGHVTPKLTVAAEATALFAFRTRGGDVDKDARRINSTAAAMLGYHVSPTLAAIAELRYQRWLENDTVEHAAMPARHNASLAIGPRMTVKTAQFTARPGLAVIVPLAGAVASDAYTSATNRYKAVFIDVPVVLP